MNTSVNVLVIELNKLRVKNATILNTHSHATKWSCHLKKGKNCMKYFQDFTHSSLNICLTLTVFYSLNFLFMNGKDSGEAQIHIQSATTSDIRIICFRCVQFSMCQIRFCDFAERCSSQITIMHIFSKLSSTASSLPLCKLQLSFDTESID